MDAHQDHEPGRARLLPSPNFSGDQGSAAASAYQVHGEDWGLADLVPPKELVDELCTDLFFSPRAREQDDNLLFVRERLLRCDADLATLLHFYEQVLARKRVPDDETTPLVSALRLSGVRRSRNGCLEGRNRIYERVFDRAWVRANMPDAEVRRQREAYRHGLLRAASVAALVVLVISTLAVMATRSRKAETRQRLAAQAAQGQAQAKQREAEVARQQSRLLLDASDMNLAQQSLKLNNLGKARRLLDQHRPNGEMTSGKWRVTSEEVPPTPGAETLVTHHSSLLTDLRDLEWRYLWQLTRGSAVVRLTNRPAGGMSVSFSPNGSRLTVGWDDGRVDLWDVPGRRLVRALTDRERAHQGRVAFSPVRNLLVATSEPKLVALYDLDSGRESMLWRAPDPGVRKVHDLAFSQDGSRVVIYAGIIVPGRIAGSSPGSTAELGDAVCVVNVSSSQLEGHSSWVCKVAFSKDGWHLISAAADQTIRLWDTSNWTEAKALRGHTAEVNAVAISETAQLVASASGNGDLMLWRGDGKSVTDGYRRLPESLLANQILPLDRSRVLLLHPGQPPEWVDLKRDSRPVLLPEIGSSTNVLGWFGTNILCHWNGTNQILVREWRGAEFVQHGAIALASAMRPTGWPTTPRANSWRGLKELPRHLFIWRASRHPAVASN